jgi:hypothetical protein
MPTSPILIFLVDDGSHPGSTAREFRERLGDISENIALSVSDARFVVATSPAKDPNTSTREG